MAGSAIAAGIEEVTVTAQKREENLQTTPIAITALSADALQNMGITGFDGLARSSPSISFTPYPSSTNLLIMYMRGQGVSDAMQITSDSSVGLYNDGFYMSRPQAATADIADIERIEVLRGPQGTLYGRNTTGGAVNFISKKPTGEFGFKQDLSFGSLDAFRSLTTVNLPKWNDISTKFTFLKSSKDGWVKNDGSSHDYGEQDQKAGRLSVRWEATDNFLVDYFFDKGNYDSTPSYYQNGDISGAICTPVNSAACYGPTPTNKFYTYNNKDAADHTYRPIDLNLSTSSFESHGLTLTWDINDSLTIKSLTGYREIDWHAYQDYAESFSGSTSFPVGYVTDDLVRSHQFSQEFQFIGNLLDNRVKYVSGLYYFDEGASHSEILDIGLPYYAAAPGVASVFGLPLNTHKDRYATSDAQSLAAYAQATWTPPILDDKLDVTVGARYTNDKRDATRTFSIDAAPFPAQFEDAKADQTFNRFNPALTVNYNWTDELSTYAKVVTGYKAGGFSESGPIGSFDQGFDPEKVVTYEVGMKSYWLDRRVRANFAVFSSKFDDLQLGFTVDPADSSVVQAYNAGKATINGAEVELLFQPIDDLSFSIDYTYLDPKLDSVKALAGTTFDPAMNSASPYQVGDSIKNVLVLPYAPQDKLNLGTDYTFLHFDKGTVAAHLDYTFQSKMYDTAPAGTDVPNRDNYLVPSYGLLNGRLILAMDLPRGDKAKIALWGKNLAHHDYKTQVIGNGNSIPTYNANNLNPVTPAGYNTQAAIWGEPASFGIDLTYEY
ncbi:MAG TPA: TonB-dependent receptor [Spongiibacteraceae bacterium]|nr:TonB-dependent receptor [Spongiibacteraceae bacterium]